MQRKETLNSRCSKVQCFTQHWCQVSKRLTFDTSVCVNQTVSDQGRADITISFPHANLQTATRRTSLRIDCVWTQPARELPITAAQSSDTAICLRRQPRIPCLSWHGALQAWFRGSALEEIHWNMFYCQKTNPNSVTFSSFVLQLISCLITLYCQKYWHPF